MVWSWPLCGSEVSLQHAETIAAPLASRVKYSTYTICSCQCLHAGSVLLTASAGGNTAGWHWTISAHLPLRLLHRNIL